MSNSEPDFDPYYTWLGIPPAEQPPTHYQLLGISCFEGNPDVIVNAAERQTRHLRSVASGPRVAAAQRLLNEVAAARICLLNPAAKMAYDQSLRSASAVVQPAPVSATPPIPPTAPTAEPPVAPVAAILPPQALPTSLVAEMNPPNAAPTVNATISSVVNRRRYGGQAPARYKAIRQAVSVVIGGLIGGAIGWFILFVYLPKLKERNVQGQLKSTPVPRSPLQATPSAPQIPSPVLEAEPGDKSSAAQGLQEPIPPPLPNTIPKVEPKQLSPRPERSEPMQPSQQRPSVAQLREQLDHVDSDKREEAAVALMEMGKQAHEAVPDLVRTLDDAYPEVQAAAVKALAAIGEDAKPAIDELYARFRKSTDDDQRGELVKAISSIDPACSELKWIVDKAILGVSGADINSINAQLLANRLWTCQHLATLGPAANWAAPTLRRLLSATARRLDIKENMIVFASCTDALVAIKADDSFTIALLQKMARGQDLRPRKDEAVQAADTALGKLMVSQ